MKSEDVMEIRGALDLLRRDVKDALGNFTYFLGLYRGGITLAYLGVAVLMYRARPFYYLEFGALSREIAEEPAVRKWSSFNVSTD